MPFIELQSVDSTNNYARSLVSEGLASDRTAVFAHDQWAGKGQRGHNWLSEKSANIILSILANTSGLAISDQFAVSMLTAVTLHDFFNEKTNGNCSIKWPNDLYWQDRKAGGILIENIIRGDNSSSAWEWTIVGIGVNINQQSFSPVLRNPVSLMQITGKIYDPVALATELFESWQINFDKFRSSGPDHFVEAYNRDLYKKEETVRFKKDNRIFEAIVKRVQPDGKLVLQHGIEEEFGFGDLEWLLTSTT